MKTKSILQIFVLVLGVPLRGLIAQESFTLSRFFKKSPHVYLLYGALQSLARMSNKKIKNYLSNRIALSSAAVINENIYELTNAATNFAKKKIDDQLQQILLQVKESKKAQEAARSFKIKLMQQVLSSTGIQIKSPIISPLALYRERIRAKEYYDHQQKALALRLADLDRQHQKEDERVRKQGEQKYQQGRQRRQEIEKEVELLKQKNKARAKRNIQQKIKEQEELRLKGLI